jgi:hypothetical protein
MADAFCRNVTNSAMNRTSESITHILRKGQLNVLSSALTAANTTLIKNRRDHSYVATIISCVGHVDASGRDSCSSTARNNPPTRTWQPRCRITCSRSPSRSEQVRKVGFKLFIIGDTYQAELRREDYRFKLYSADQGIAELQKETSRHQWPSLLT